MRQFETEQDTGVDSDESSQYSPNYKLYEQTPEDYIFDRVYDNIKAIHDITTPNIFEERDRLESTARDNILEISQEYNEDETTQRIVYSKIIVAINSLLF